MGEIDTGSTSGGLEMDIIEEMVLILTGKTITRVVHVVHHLVWERNTELILMGKTRHSKSVLKDGYRRSF